MRKGLEALGEVLELELTIEDTFQATFGFHRVLPHSGWCAC
jgi:hypothetical protein